MRTRLFGTPGPAPRRAASCRPSGQHRAVRARRSLRRVGRPRAPPRGPSGSADATDSRTPADPLRRRLRRLGVREPRTRRGPYGKRWRRSWPRWGCGCRRRRPPSSTSTKASTSWASASSGTASGEPGIGTSTPTRRKKSLDRDRRKVKAITRQGTNQRLSELLRQLNAALRGWTAYFQHGVSESDLRLPAPLHLAAGGQMARREHAAPTGRLLRRRYSVKGWWPDEDGRTLFDPPAVTVTRYRYRGNIPTPWTPHEITGPRPRPATRPSGEPGRGRLARPVRGAARRNGPAERRAPRCGPTPPRRQGPRPVPAPGPAGHPRPPRPHRTTRSIAPGAPCTPAPTCSPTKQNAPARPPCSPATQHVEVEATWGIYQRMIAAYRDPDRDAGPRADGQPHRLASATASPTALSELITLGRTLNKRAADVLGLLRPPRHQQRPDRGHQRPTRTPARLRPRLPQPHQLHRTDPLLGSRRVQAPTTPSLS